MPIPPLTEGDALRSLTVLAYLEDEAQVDSSQFDESFSAGELTAETQKIFIQDVRGIFTQCFFLTSLMTEAINEENEMKQFPQI